MSIFIERHEGPSKLEERLEPFKDPETGDVLLTKGQATDILRESLLGFYRSQVSSPSLKIEALVQIVRTSLPDDKFNFTEVLEEAKRLQVKRDAKRREMERKPHIITPREPPQPEI